jgi:cytidine deaminase
MSPEEINMLVEKAIDAKEHSYSPYSKFRVGCALLTNDDKIFIGNLCFFMIPKFIKTK